MDPSNFTIVIHGGAGNIPNDRVEPKLKGMKNAITEARKVYMESNPKDDPESVVVRSAVAAVVVMEDDPVFNAGRGSVLNQNGEVEMDAAVMVGSNCKFGAVGAIQRVKNPVIVAQTILDGISGPMDHPFYAGEGVLQFAKEHGIPEVDPEYLITDAARKALDKVLAGNKNITNEIGEGEKQLGTVGAIVFDRKTRKIAVATSTGGISGKKAGRIGDTPVIGAGFYASNCAAVCTTGTGDAFLRGLVSKRIHDGIKSNPNDISKVIKESLAYMSKEIGGEGGAIAISTQIGELGFDFNSKRLAWAYLSENDTIHSGCDANNTIIENISS